MQVLCKILAQESKCLPNRNTDSNLLFPILLDELLRVFVFHSEAAQTLLLHFKKSSGYQVTAVHCFVKSAVCCNDKHLHIAIA
jgi:hypothetical protein